MRPPFAASLVILAFSASLGAADAQPTLSDQPPGLHAQPMAAPDFLDTLAQFDEFEVQAARLAMARSTGAHVREAAERVVRDQHATRLLIAGAAQRAGLAAPRSPGLDLGQDQKLNRLRSVRGARFDQVYVEQQVRTCRTTVDLLTTYARDGEPGPIREVAVRLTSRARACVVDFARLSAAD